MRPNSGEDNGIFRAEMHGQNQQLLALPATEFLGDRCHARAHVIHSHLCYGAYFVKSRLFILSGDINRVRLLSIGGRMSYC
jgi:hypothetical protein